MLSGENVNNLFLRLILKFMLIVISSYGTISIVDIGVKFRIYRR